MSDRTIYTKEIAVADYMSDYRDAPYFIELCKACRNYGNSWLCPPLEFDVDERLKQWNTALIVLFRFERPKNADTREHIRALFCEHRGEMEKRLLELEREYGGLAMGFSGECLLCDECARKNGAKCVHPKKSRPSLEAYGINIGKTMEDLFDIRIEWAKDGKLPKTYSLVGALFHNQSPGTIRF